MIRTRRAGFTLIELTLVLAIVAVLLLLVMPALENAGPRTRLNLAARQIAGTVRWLRSEAISSGRDRWLRYEIGRSRLVPIVRGPDSRAADTLSAKALPEGIRLESVAVGGRPPVSGESVTVRFSPLGTVDAHTVAIRTGNGNRLILHVNPLTGTMKTEDDEATP